MIVTVAGSVWTFPGDGLLALNAPISQVVSLSADRNGAILFADPRNNVVSRLNPGGTITLIAGNGIAGLSGDGGPARSASLNNPTDAVMDSAGNLYISDSFNNRIRRVTQDGVISTWVPNVTGARLAVDAGGNLYFSSDQCLIYRDTPAGVLTKFAGNGVCGAFGEGVAATQAGINPGLGGLAVDAAGNLYFGEEHNYRIRKVTADGSKITTYAGTGQKGYSGNNVPALAASLNFPQSLAFDATGALFFSDVNNAVVRRIAPDGIITTIAGTPNGEGYSGDGGPALKALMAHPEGVAFDRSGSLYISDSRNSRIRRIAAGAIATVAGNGLFRATPDGMPAIQSFLDGPAGLAFDRAGALWVAEFASSRVARIGADGAFHVAAGVGTPGAGPDNAPGLGGLDTGGSIPANHAALEQPQGIISDSNGAIYFTDPGAQVVYRLSSAGALSVAAGQIFTPGSAGDGGPATKATLTYPYGLALDSSGALYISDSSANLVRRVSPQGTISTIAGKSAPLLSSPQGLAIDAKGNLLICDSGANRIRRVDPSGAVTIIAGDGRPVSAGDGGPAVTASLNFPSDIAVDAQGNIYFLETGRLRRIDPAGIITTVGGSGALLNSGDGGPAGSASLNVDRIAIDNAGNLLLSSSHDNIIRKIIYAEPAFTVQDTSLSFNGLSGAAQSDPQTIPIDAAVPGVRFTIASDSPWLVTQAGQASTPYDLTVIADPSGLAPGSYQGALQLTRFGGAAPFANIAVAFTVASGAPARLAVEPDILRFSLTQSGAPQTQTLRILNAGSGSLDFAVAIDGAGASAVSLSSPGGDAAAGSPVALVVTADPGVLASGTYSPSLTVSSSLTGETITIPITISVVARPQRMALSQAGLLFTASQSSGVTPSQNFSVLNIGEGTFDWTAAPVFLTDGPPWLLVTPAAGFSGAGAAAGQVSVAVDPSQLPAPGVYYGLVRISSTGAANAPQDVEVVFRLLGTDDSPAPAIAPSGLVFPSAAAAESPSSQLFTVSNRSRSPLVLSNIIANTSDGGVWLAVAPTSAIIPPGGSQTITVQPNSAALAPGVYNATITALFQDVPAQSVNVLLVVSPSGVAAKDGKTAEGCTPTQLLPVLTSLPPGLAVPAGWPVYLEALIIDECSTPQTSGEVAVSFTNGDPLLPLVSLGEGRWQSTWSGRNTRASQFTMTLNASEPSPKLSKSVPYFVTLQPNGSLPALNPGGVTVEGVTQPGATLAPGSIISINGSSFAAVSSAAAGLPLATDLGGTEVLMAGRLLPMLYSSEGKIRALVPYDVPPDSQYTLIVSRGGVLSTSERVAVAAAQPAILLVDASADPDTPTKLWSALTSGTPIDPTQVSPASPVHAGDRLVVYCTGLGAVNSALDVAAAVPSAPLVPLDPSNPLSATIGGANAAVQSAGLVRGLTGVYQIQLTVPGNVPPAQGIPLVLSAGGRASAPVQLTVSQP